MVPSLRSVLRFLLVVASLLVVTGAVGATPISVVAAENFYGNIVSQLGGTRVAVLSILSDPNVDPHEYESNVANAKAVATADLVIENSGGYDDWMDKLLSASPNAHRVVLKGFALAPTRLSENEHVWYDPQNVVAISKAIVESLKTLDPTGKAVYEKNLATFLGEVQKVTAKVAALKAKINGTPIALTETIFLYQAGPLGLKAQTPFEFMKAIAEGNDPAAADAVTAEDQIKKKQVKVLVYNAQTSTAATDKLQSLAKAAGIPVVPVTETMPPAESYQVWMLRQLSSLEAALKK